MLSGQHNFERRARDAGASGQWRTPSGGWSKRPNKYWHCLDAQALINLCTFITINSHNLTYIRRCPLSIFDRTGVNPTWKPRSAGADAFVLLYSVTDKCSFDECCRLRFLIGYNKRRRRHLVNIRYFLFHVTGGLFIFLLYWT